MGENHVLLRGRPADWIHKVKDDIFLDNDNITAKKVRDKFTNMKKAGMEAKMMQEQSGFGLREEDCEWSISGMIHSSYLSTTANVQFW